MRKLRDYDAELRVLGARSRALKAKWHSQLGELVVASGAAQLDAEILAGALLAAASGSDEMKEAWRKDGASFFQERRVKARKGTRHVPTRTGEAPRDGAAG
ncbi:conjugal transfer protein TraD [Rhizorhabdus argentea]|uniref:conjugal transfer protein TraD n=1 Tax=Rhizorhabdus argentea TaxID=1387174 RepID=UPI0030ECF115